MRAFSIEFALTAQACFLKKSEVHRMHAAHECIPINMQTRYRDRTRVGLHNCMLKLRSNAPSIARSNAPLYNTHIYIYIIYYPYSAMHACC